MSDIPSLLEEMSRLMQLKGENPFKVRAFEKAASVLAGREDLHERARSGTLTELPGVGQGIAAIVSDFVLSGSTSALDELRSSLPEGLLELTTLPGLGPKKARQLIDELGIRSISELEYACRENRLAALKGFGEKQQKKILEGISFSNASQGQQRLVDAIPLAARFLEFLPEFLKEEGILKAKGAPRVVETGALRRKLETLSQLEFLVEEMDPSVRALFEKAAHAFQQKQMGKGGFRIHLEFAPSHRFGSEWARTTGTLAHWQALGAPSGSDVLDVATEEDFYARLKLPWIAPEFRETGEEVQWAHQGKLDSVLPWDGVQGIFHNHTVFSDGAATLEEMVVEAKRQGYRYIGISDHSQTAFYARGLKPEDLLAQQKEIKKLQDQHPEIRIFWGIESDILADGSLDYEDKWLKKFDFVIASIHSRFQMDRQAMTDRMITAIRNPYTRFLGHMTGRLLLGRKAYELETEKIIAEAKLQNVAIEINANPARLDIDWRWGPELRKNGTLISVNPDAHDVEGIADTVFGVGVARKALLPSSQVVNARSVREVEKWLGRDA